MEAFWLIWLQSYTKNAYFLSSIMQIQYATSKRAKANSRE